MNKGIKYFGIVLAIFLILIIVSFSIFAVSTVFSFVVKDTDVDINEFETINYEENIKGLDIELSASKLTIEKGEKNSLETNNSYITNELIDGILYIKEKNHIFYKKNNLEVVLTLNSDVYDNVNIKNGAGTFYIDDLKANNLNIKFGAGSGIFYNLEVYNNTNIESGVGEIEVLDGVLNNLNLKAGIGKFGLTTVIKGKSNINTGIGDFYLNLKDSQDNYTVNVNKGLGVINVNGDKVSDKTIGNGDNVIDIKGGIGRININFDYKEESSIEVDEDSSIKILEYFKNKDDDWIIVGEIEEGYFEDNMEVKLMNDDEEKGTAILQDLTIRYADYSIDDATIKDKVYIKIENINEEQLKLINYIKK